MSPIVAKLIAEQLNKDKDWENKQVVEFAQLAEGYLLGGS